MRLLLLIAIVEGLVILSVIVISIDNWLRAKRNKKAKPASEMFKKS